MAFIDEELARLRVSGLYNTVHVIGSGQGAWIEVDGAQVLNLCSNNYLGLAGHPRVKAAARDAVERFGAGPAAVRSIAGTLTLHRELERKLALFKGVEAALSFQSGFMANLAVIPALAGEGDEIFSDELNHASIIDGSRLTKAAKTRYAHADMGELSARLGESKAARKLVVTDGVFSMDGDIAPLDIVVDIAREHGAMVMVDDAHGEGVLGRGGRGIVDYYGLTGQVDIEVGTMSKAFGVVGGYVAASAKVVDYLVQKARPFLFSSAMTAADTAACIASVDIMAESEELVERLWKNAEHFQSGMIAAGFDLGVTKTPITPVIVGDVDMARRLSAMLLADGVFAHAIGFPTVPMGRARIRCMVSAAHTTGDLDLAVEKFTKAGRELGLIG